MPVVASSFLRERLVERIDAASLTVSDEVLNGLDAYLHLLDRWNRRINLTSFDLSEPTDAALDRLVVEPLLAARFVRSDDRLGVDIGSGGGSPAFPLKLSSGCLSMALVESRTRKAAFLREVARTLGLRDVRVESCRFEEFGAREENRARFDLVSLRAVKADQRLWGAVAVTMRNAGRVLWLGGAGRQCEHEDFRICMEEGSLKVLEKVSH